MRLIAGLIAAFALLAAPAQASEHGLGAAPPGSQERLSRAEAADVRAQAATAPASVDLTPFAMPVGNQGGVGSCAAWATVYAAMGYWLNKQAIAGGPLAPMYTYAQISHGVDAGSYPQDNLQIAETEGVDSRTHYSHGDFDFTAQPTAGDKANAAHWRLSDFEDLDVWQNQLTNQPALKAALAEGRPVVISLPVYSDFDAVRTANHGSYTHTGGYFRGYHAVAALGYDATGLRIQNSWGTAWGDAGFATLSWDFVNEYVYDAVAVDELEDDAPPAPVSAPVVTGNPVNGATLTATQGDWSPSAISYGYQWQRDAVDIPAATGATYALTADDIGHPVRVVVTATNAYGSGASASTATAPVIEPPVATVLPSISGVPTDGQTLQAATGSWSPAGLTFSYQWLQCGSGYCMPIYAATHAAYTTTVGDIGKTLAVRVKATGADGAYGTAESPRTATIVARPLTLVRAPEVTGTARPGETLVTEPGVWSLPLTDWSYQWRRCSGAACTNIPGATWGWYTLTANDLGKTIVMRVNAFSPMRNATADSVPTGVVSLPPADDPAPDTGADDTVEAPPPAPVITPPPPVAPVAPVSPVAPVAPEFSGTAQVGRTLVLRSSSGAVVAKATVALKKGTATVTVKGQAAGYRAWACAKKCTAPVKLGAKPTKLSVKVAKGERVRVIVAK